MYYRPEAQCTTFQQHNVTPYSSTMYLLTAPLCTTLQQHHVPPYSTTMYHLTAAPCTTLQQHNVLTLQQHRSPCFLFRPTLTKATVTTAETMLLWYLRTCCSGGTTSNLYFRGNRFEFWTRQRISGQTIRDFSQFPKTKSGEVPQQDMAIPKSIPILHSPTTLLFNVTQFETPAASQNKQYIKK